MLWQWRPKRVQDAETMVVVGINCSSGDSGGSGGGTCGVFPKEICTHLTAENSVGDGGGGGGS